MVEARLSQPEDAETMDLHKNYAVSYAVKCLKIFYYASLFGGQIEKEASGYLSKSKGNNFDFPGMTVYVVYWLCHSYRDSVLY